jgi:hypothetical protein
VRQGNWGIRQDSHLVTLDAAVLAVPHKLGRKKVVHNSPGKKRKGKERGQY